VVFIITCLDIVIRERLGIVYCFILNCFRAMPVTHQSTRHQTSSTALVPAPCSTRPKRAGRLPQARSSRFTATFSLTRRTRRTQATTIRPISPSEETLPPPQSATSATNRRRTGGTGNAPSTTAIASSDRSLTLI